MRIDTSTDFGARVAGHLDNDQVVWLTTVGPDGTPQPSPVWFIWDGDTALVYSQPATPKLRNIEQNGRASLSFNSTPSGEDVVILTGAAWIDLGAPPANANPTYVEKYTGALQSIGMTADEFTLAYSVPVRVRPTSLRGF